MPPGAAPVSQEGGTILAHDGGSAFNSMLRSEVLPAISSVASDLVRYANHLHASTPPKLLHRMDHGSIGAIYSLRSVQPRFDSGAPCYGAGGLETLRSLKEAPPEPGTRFMAFIDGIVVRYLPRTSAGDSSCRRSNEISPR